MAFFFRRVLAAIFLFLNFLLYIALAVLAGWILDIAIDDGWEALSSSPATFYFVLFALVAGAVGVAAKFNGGHHVRAWHDGSFAGAYAAAFIAWTLTLVATGIACKEIVEGGTRDLKLIVLEVLAIVLAGTQLLYIITLGIGMCVCRRRKVRSPEAVEPHATPKEPAPIETSA